ncbi:MAG: hypothetical protein M3081_22425, partial [Gemmatimonadota bacterium]|nr:hypothetical protein [Gemmatimonadota bacterium]
MQLNASSQPDDVSLIAGSVLPLKRAEELLVTLPGVISARIVADISGAIDEIHMLASPEVPPKQMVRNAESALIAHLGLHVDHRKISIATTTEPQTRAPEVRGKKQSSGEAELPRRRVYFEDIEVRRSRSKGVSCHVTLRKGIQTFEGEAEGPETPRARAELSARAALLAVEQCEGTEHRLTLDGCKLIDAFDREFVFVGITTRFGRESTMLTGSCEVKDSPETAA